MLSPTDNRSAANSRPRATAAAACGEMAGLYLTDEVFLYRVVGSVAGEGGEVVELEDSYGLDVVRVAVRDLRARRLRVVTAAAKG